jgi:lysine 2,3-aminomutase
MGLPLLRGRESRPPLRPVRTQDTAQTSNSVPVIGANRPALRFVVGASSREFYARFYPGTSLRDWNDWHWQFRNRIRTLRELERIFVLSDGEREAVGRHEGPLPVGITPYYASLMGREDPSEPLRRTHIMTGDD